MKGKAVRFNIEEGVEPQIIDNVISAKASEGQIMGKEISAKVSEGQIMGNIISTKASDGVDAAPVEGASDDKDDIMARIQKTLEGIASLNRKFEEFRGCKSCACYLPLYGPYLTTPNTDDLGEKVSKMLSPQLLGASLQQFIGPAKQDLSAEEKLGVFGGATPSLEAIGKMLASPQIKNVVVLGGAGMSTAAGIPDFRSPNTGLYANLQKYDLPSPQDLFSISFFDKNPKPFFDFMTTSVLSKSYKPTPAHKLVKLLQDKSKLLRLYTQNIDNLDIVAGVREENVVEVHGHSRTACCRKCVRIYAVTSLCFNSISLCRAHSRAGDAPFLILPVTCILEKSHAAKIAGKVS